MRHPLSGSGRHRFAATTIASVLAAVTALALAACGSSSSSSSSTPTSTGTTATSAASAGASKTVATVASDELIKMGTLTLCADFPSPPGHFFSASNQMEGYDIALGDQLGKELGLKTVWLNTPFASIILAAQTGKCDMIWSGMSITAPREKVLKMIPYFSVGESFITLKGNPDKLPNPAADQLGFCGHTLAAEQGSYELTLLQALSSKCTKAGKPALTLTTPENNSTALEDVMTKHAEAWMTGSDLAGYVVNEHSSEVETLGQVIDKGEYGLAIPPKRTSLIAGVDKALRAMEADGSYQAILKKWGQPTTDIPKPTINPKVAAS